MHFPHYVKARRVAVGVQQRHRLRERIHILIARCRRLVMDQGLQVQRPLRMQRSRRQHQVHKHVKETLRRPARRKRRQVQPARLRVGRLLNLAQRRETRPQMHLHRSHRTVARQAHRHHLCLHLVQPIAVAVAGSGPVGVDLHMHRRRSAQVHHFRAPVGLLQRHLRCRVRERVNLDGLHRHREGAARGVPARICHRAGHGRRPNREGAPARRSATHRVGRTPAAYRRGRKRYRRPRRPGCIHRPVRRTHEAQRQRIGRMHFRQQLVARHIPGGVQQRNRRRERIDILVAGPRRLVMDQRLHVDRQRIMQCHPAHMHFDEHVKEAGRRPARGERVHVHPAQV